MRRASTTRWIFGMLLVAIGVLFLLDSTGAIEVDSAWDVIWPTILAFLGAWFLIRERGRSVLGAVLLLLGAGFFAEHAEWIRGGWIGRYWPVALILVGLAILLEATGASRRRETERSERGEDWLDSSAFMSGRKERVTSHAWRGGDVTAIMGGVELDLRDAEPAAEGAVLDVTAVMGGVEVRVPEGWRVELRGTPILGGFEDKTTSPRGAERPPTLRVVGTAVMGGVEVKH